MLSHCGWYDREQGGLSAKILAPSGDFKAFKGRKVIERDDKLPPSAPLAEFTHHSLDG